MTLTQPKIAALATGLVAIIGIAVYGRDLMYWIIEPQVGALAQQIDDQTAVHRRDAINDVQNDLAFWHRELRALDNDIADLRSQNEPVPARWISEQADIQLRVEELKYRLRALHEAN